MSGSSYAQVTPTNFVAGSTDLVIVGKGTEGYAVAEAKLKGLTTCAKLNIVSQPLVNLTVGVYYVYDANSPLTSPVGGPSTNDLVDTLNDVFKQAQVHFTLGASCMTNVAYDSSGHGTNTNGMFEYFTEILDLYGVGKQQVNVLFLKKSGTTYNDVGVSDGGTNMIRGMTITSDKAGALFIDDLPSAAWSLAAAHELGHILSLAAIKDPAAHNHDSPPWPVGEESLMRDGLDTNNVPVPSPGRWLRHEDWTNANNKAGGL